MTDDVEVVDDADLVLDGILGIGGHGGLRPPADEVAERLSASPCGVVAVDLPSGVDASTGVEGTAVRADVTVTLVRGSPACSSTPVRGTRATLSSSTSVSTRSSANLPSRCRTTTFASCYPVATAELDKYRRGVVGVVAGSGVHRRGRAVHWWCLGRGRGHGALRRSAAPSGLVRNGWPEVVLGEGRCQAWVVGPGLGQDDVRTNGYNACSVRTRRCSSTQTG